MCGNYEEIPITRDHQMSGGNPTGAAAVLLLQNRLMWREDLFTEHTEPTTQARINVGRAENRECPV